MPDVIFLPKNAVVKVAHGASLLDAATTAGVLISAPCGGEGTCGECRVRIEKGSVEYALSGCLTPAEASAGWTLACSCRVTGDVTVRVPEAHEGAGKIVTEAFAASPAAGVIRPEPLAKKQKLTVAAPSLENSFSDFDRLTSAMHAGIASILPAAEQANKGGQDARDPKQEFACGLGVLRQLAAALRAKDGLVTVTLTEQATQGPVEVIRIEPGDTTTRAFGLAIDIGTTTCAVQLVNLANGRLLDTACDYNGQIPRGLDIISRINYAKKPERREELRQLVLQTLNSLITQLCRNHSVAPAEIDNAVVAGNTTMIHLLLGLDPEYIRLEPYTPTINQTPWLRAAEVGLAMNPEAFVMCAPGVGSYVGGDITAGLLQTELINPREQVRLFLDIGTNGEIVLGNGEWLMACACSAGPAFEGSGIGCGMRAMTGAIERVRIERSSGRPEYAVVGGGKPRGICGSGLIDLLAELWMAGLLEPSGKFVAERGGGRIRPAGQSTRNLAFTVVPASESATGQELAVTEQDIQNLLRTKAAVYSAIGLMLKSAGLSFNDIMEVCVAGGFGRFLDIQKSIHIGLLPDLPLERFKYLGNSSLAGARAMLVSAAARAKVAEVARRITYLELNVDPAYMDEYTGALFLPHTDLGRFPSVKALSEERNRLHKDTRKED